MTLGIGFLAAGVAAIGFGSNFAPCKKYDMGDGMTFQMMMALGVWMTGVVYAIIQAATSNDTVFFHPIALLGGVIWSIGNVCTVPVIKTIGMALGLAIWSSTSIIVGWFTGKFGLLGTPKDHSVQIEWLNYVGIGVILLALVGFFQVSPTNEDDDDDDNKNNNDERQIESAKLEPNPVNEATQYMLEKHSKHSKHSTHSKHDKLPKVETHIFNPAIGHMESPAIIGKRFEFVSHTADALERREYEHEIEVVESWIDALNRKQQVILGISMSVFAGICYGLVFCPIQYCIHHHEHNRLLYPKSLEQYAFTHFSGILMTSTIIFIGYAMKYKNMPQANPQTLFPSIASGLLWGIAQIGFFVAQDPDNLGTETSFPIVASSPQIVASVWGVFVFKEVTGGSSLIKLVCAISMGVCGIICIALSRTDI